MSRRFRGMFFAVLLAGLGAAGVTNADDHGPCKIATKGATPTAKACATGGRDAARKLMTDMVSQARKKGQTFTCDGCHKDMDNYELTKNANADYKKLEAAIAKK
jgi:hypothetical protein